MEFANTYIFFVFGILFFLVLGIFFWRKKKKKDFALRVHFMEDLKKAQQQSSHFSFTYLFYVLKWCFFIVTLVFLTIALARPQNITEEKHIAKNGVDILVALDVSESMLAEDLSPNRIEAAKKYIDKFVSELRADRIGLEVFAGKSFTQSPLSFDYNVVRYYLSEISTDTINQRFQGLGGTAIGDTIVSAVNRFQNDKERTKVLILLTDGEANVGIDPLFASEHARTNGIKIYTLGLGKREGAPVPIENRNGKKIYAKNRDGSLFITTFDEEALQNIAHISGGQYFYAGDNTALRRSFETINALEKKEYEGEVSLHKEDLFWKYLGYSLMTAFLSLFFWFGSPYIEKITLRIKRFLSL